MDDLFLFLSEEIALEGDSGCTLQELWTLVETFNSRRENIPQSTPHSGTVTQPLATPSVDDHMKLYLWKWICNMSDVTVTVLDQATEKPIKDATKKARKAEKPITPITSKSNLPKSIASTPPSELELTYGNRLRLVSSEEAQRNALLGQMDVNYVPSPSLMRVLASVARTRAVGATQADMSKELGIDPRSLFHFVKTLCAKGLITKFPVVTKGFYTNLCIHMRYAPQNAAYMATQATIASAKSSQQPTVPSMSSTTNILDPVLPPLNASSVPLSALEPSKTTFFAGGSNFNVRDVSFHGELIRQKISDLLSASKTKVMVIGDLMNVVFCDQPAKKQRKWFNRTIADMGEKNFLERVDVPKVTRGIDRCVRLLKPFVPKSEMKHDDDEDKDDLSSDPDNSDDEASVSNTISSSPRKRRHGLLADLPIEFQVYRLISISGASGITAGQIQARLSNIYARLLTKILTRLLKPPADVGCSLRGVNRIAEFHGRERRYRYYLSNHFEAIQKQHGFGLAEGEEGDVQETEDEPSPKTASVGKIRGSPSRSSVERPEFSTPAASTPRKPRTLSSGTAGKDWQTPAYNQPNIAADGEEYVQLFSNVEFSPGQTKCRRMRNSGDEDSEPTTGRSSKRKARENLRKCVTEETIDVENVRDGESAAVEVEDNTTCSVCNNPNDDELLLLCDGCENAQHTYCATPSLDSVPEGDWYCNGPSCKRPAEEDTADGNNRNVLMEACRISSTVESWVPTSRDANQSNPTGAVPSGLLSYTVLEKEVSREQEISAKSKRPLSLHHQTTVQNTFDRLINGAGKSAAKSTKDGKIAISGYNRSSITALQRKKILLALLEEQRVVEVGYQLIRDYQECFKARYPEDVGKSTIDKKTFIRSANALEEDGLLRQYTIKMPLIHGGYTTKNLFLHRDLSPQSAEVKEYVLSIQDKAMLVGGAYKPVKVTGVEQVEVERLNDMKYRLTNTMEGEPSSAPAAATSAITKTSRANPANPEFWMYAAQDFGWIPAKMIRVKLIHQWLASRFFGAYNNQEPDIRIDTERRIVQSTLLFHEMPLDIYFQCIGHTQVNEELLDWVRKCPDPRQVRLMQLPNEIRQHIFSKNYKYRRSVKTLIDILVALKLISPVWRDYETSQQASSHQVTITTSAEGLAPAYTLHPTVPMYDFSRPRCSMTGNRVFIRNYNLDSIADVAIFWSELQFVAQQAVTETTRQGDSDDEDGEALSDTERSTKLRNEKAKQTILDPLRCINSPRNWYSMYPFTTAQRKALEEHVDRRTGTTPLNDEAMIMDLARRMEVIPYRVRNYFKKIETEFEKKSQSIKEKRNLMVLETERKKRAAGTEGDTGDVEEGPHGDIRRRRRRNLSKRLRASADARMASSAPRGTLPRIAPEPTPAGTKRKRPEDDVPSNWGRKTQRRNYRAGAEDEILVLGEDERFRNQYESVSGARRSRMVWLEEDDEMILLAYIVLKTRHPSRFAWAPAASLLPGRTGDNCRRRVVTLLKRPAVAARAELLMMHWEELRANFLASGELSEPPPHIVMDTETLRLHVKYLADGSSNLPSRPVAMLPSVKIPSTMADFSACADYAYALPFDEEVFFEDGIENMPSSRAKIQTLYSYAFGIRAFLGDAAADTPVSEMEEGKTVSWVNRKIVKEVVKMILMTPEGRYDPTHAYQILSRYPFVDSTAGMEEARDDGCIVKVRSGVGIDRRVPGRGYHVSDKFLTIMSGILPSRLLPRAAAYHERLVRQLTQRVDAPLEPTISVEARTEMSPLITDGGMACWLNLMAARQIIATPVFPGFDEHNLVPGNSSRQVDRRKLDCKIVITPKQDLAATLSRDFSTTLLSGLPHLFTAETVASQNGQRLEYLRGLIEEAGSEGATLAQLLEKMKISYPHIGAEELRLYVSTLLQKPTETSPNETRNAPVITCGVSTKRFVSSKYVGLWWVQTNASLQERLAPPAAMLPTTGQSDPASTPLAKMYPRDEDVSKYSQPKMWFDISGNAVEPVLRGCMESLIGHVLTKPGISEANLYRRFSSVMSRLELRDSLEELVVRRALRRTVMKRPERVSLFSKPRAYRIVGSDEEIADEKRATFYFLQDHYYLKTSTSTTIAKAS